MVRPYTCANICAENAEIMTKECKPAMPEGDRRQATGDRRQATGRRVGGFHRVRLVVRYVHFVHCVHCVHQNGLSTMERQERKSGILNAPLLSLLKAGEWATEQEIARSTGLAGLRLERELKSLRRFGFAIESAGSGFRLAGAPDAFFPDELTYGLDTAVIGRNIVVLERVSSTNDAAWELAGNGAADGLVVLAEEQTHGRGRMGRSWFSPRGGLWMSIVLIPGQPAERATAITMAASVAVARAIRTFPGCDASIRWPNDILIDGRKVAGVMVETGSSRSLHGTFILGIGVDVNCTEFPREIEPLATALAVHAGGKIRPADLARLIIRFLDELYSQIVRGEHAAIGDEWLALSSTVGQRITIMRNGRTYRGEVVDMDPVAGLMVRLDSGFVRAFKGEHVTVVK